MIPAFRPARVAGLRTLALALVSVALGGCISTEQVAVSEDTVYSPPLHWTITKPKTWELVGSREIRDAQRTVGTTNKLYNYVQYQSGSVPFVAMRRTYQSDASYGVWFEIYREPLEEERFASNEKIVGQQLWPYLYVVSGAHLVGPIVNVKVAGQEFANGRVQYTLSAKSGKSVTMQREIWARRTGLSAIIITAAYDIRDQSAAVEEIQQIIRSIHVRKDS